MLTKFMAYELVICICATVKILQKGYAVGSNKNVAVTVKLKLN